MTIKNMASIFYTELKSLGIKLHITMISLRSTAYHNQGLLRSTSYGESVLRDRIRNDT